MRATVLASLLMLTGVGAADAAVITFIDSDLGSGNPVTVGGTTATTTTVGGSISFIGGSGGFAGLWLGSANTSGSYTLSFSSSIDSIEVEFDALSSVGSGAPETLSSFATNNGSISIGYVNQSGTTFDGTTITSTVNDGQGIFSFAGPSFTSLTFTHNQGAQSGFVIERIVINTAGGTGSVPEPASLALWGVGLVGLSMARRRRASPKSV